MELGGVEATRRCRGNIGAVEMKPTKQAKAEPQQTLRNFGTVVGTGTYGVWVRRLGELVPDGRTHRLSVMLAGMLRYAAAIAADNQDEKGNEHSLASSLLEATEASDRSEVEDLIHDAVVQLFKDAKVRFERSSARGDRYSIAEDAYAEFVHWYDMPWD
jgi:NaMN:DMB phosphoribosyltransferase